MKLIEMMSDYRSLLSKSEISDRQVGWVEVVCCCLCDGRARCDDKTLKQSLPIASQSSIDMNTVIVGYKYSDIGVDFTNPGENLFKWDVLEINISASMS